MAEQVRVDMSLDEVAAAVGADNPIFCVRSINPHEGGDAATFSGHAHTEPPLNWHMRVEGASNIGLFQPNEIISPAELAVRGIGSTFILAHTR